MDHSANNIVALNPSDILIFLHIPKTGGLTMDRILARNFPGPQCLELPFELSNSALLIRSSDNTIKRYYSLPEDQRKMIRCIMGTEGGNRGIHFQFGIHRKLDRPAKYFTIVRDPIDRVISNFYHNRTQQHLPSYKFIKNMTLEQYLDSGIGVDAFDHQVRILSGCPELDATWDPAGKRISALPVERRHLEMAKKNIEKYFIAAAPLEEFNALLLLLKRLCGWRFHQIMYKIHNETPDRPMLSECSDAIRRRIEMSNLHDIELYQWVKERFAAQVDALGPGFSREERRFTSINRTVQWLERHLSARARSIAKRLVSA